MKTVLQFIFLLITSYSAMAVSVDSPLLPASIQSQLIKSIKPNPTKAPSTSTSFATVGSSNQCDYYLGTTPIQDAIDAGEIELRLVSETFTENIIINDKSITIKGGYSDCAAAEAGNLGILNYSTIQGVTAANKPVISVTGDSQRHNITLSLLLLTNGSGVSFFPGGGISTINSDSEIIINNSLISGNLGQSGGGIAMIAGSTDIHLYDTRINSNSAKYGGGIYCTGANNSIFMHDDSELIGNSTTSTTATRDGKGGGAYLSNGCYFQIFSSPDFFTKGIDSNLAKIEGGGIYAESGAKAVLFGHELCNVTTCVGNNNMPVHLRNNDADNITGASRGGGAFVTGAGTELFIYAAAIEENNTGKLYDYRNYDSHGGAVYLADSAKLVVKRLESACWSQNTCNYFNENYADVSVSSSGGAIYNNDSTAEISHAIFENNHADIASVIHVAGPNALTTIENSILHHNTSPVNGINFFLNSYVFAAENNSNLDIKWSTIADNSSTYAVFDIENTSSTELISSIVNEIPEINLYDFNPGTIVTDCNIVHEVNSFIPNSTTIVDDPQFVDRVNNDYHIKSTSPAIDYCNASGIIKPDIDFTQRGVDDPSVNNNNGGTYDAGADEFFINEIFNNGFE